MRKAIDTILGFVAGMSFEEYDADLLVRSAVERHLGILGEAMSAIVRVDPDTASQISEARQIIGLRNVLIHRYMRIDNKLVWVTVEDRVAPLLAEIEELLRDAPE
jgi:uncharacterized protein with HEPN domain